MEAGGSTVTSLMLQWDAGSSGMQWTTLVGDFPSSTMTQYIVSGIQAPGRIFQFKYKASNIFGWSAFSDVA